MDWTNLMRSLYATTTSLEQADLIPKLKIAVKRIQQLSKFALTILLALIFSITGVALPLPLTNTQVANALSVNKALLPSLDKILTTTLQTASSFVTSGSSFLSDNSIFKPTLAPTFAPTFTPTFAPTLAPTFAPTFAPNLSLFRFDFYFDIKEFNLVKVINAQPSRPSPALEYYQQGVEKSKNEDYKGAVKYFSEALSKDGNFAEAYVSRGRTYSELGDWQRANEHQQKAYEYSNPKSFVKNNYC